MEDLLCSFTHFHNLCSPLVSTAVIPSLLQASFHLDEGVSPLVLQLLTCALCGVKGQPTSSSSSSSSSSSRAKRERERKEKEKDKDKDKDKSEEKGELLMFTINYFPCMILK